MWGDMGVQLFLYMALVVIALVLVSQSDRWQGPGWGRGMASG